ncbi:FecR family protein [Seleniivibrio woodruffii]|uniref:FecR family protein n=1 Tax=Seleniivibrio woodruffii TaxID=1078050 RepID=UPI00104EA9BB|nr:FecR family protein [Seleniivibrio woodruffii]TVZ35369.1 FecR family protein [Seleniivibrio woodruffii]
MKRITALFVAVMMVSSQVFAASVAGTVKVVKGGVDVVKAQAVMGKVAKEGLNLSFDDILRTKRKGYAEVSFVDGSDIKVFEKSRLLLLGQDRTKDGFNAEIQKGKVLFKVEKMHEVAGDFRIKTSNAVIGVKGTVVAGMVDPTGTTVECISGLVVVGPPLLPPPPPAPVPVAPPAFGSQPGGLAIAPPPPTPSCCTAPRFCFRTAGTAGSCGSS